MGDTANKLTTPLKILFFCYQQKYIPPVKNSNSFIVQQRFKHGAERADILNQGNLGKADEYAETIY